MLLPAFAWADDLSTMKRTPVELGDIHSLKRGQGVASTDVNTAEPLQVVVPLCRDYISHRSNAAINHHGGEVVNGKPIIAADINADLGSAMIPDPIRIPVTIDAAKRLNLSVQGLQMETQFPPVELYRDGRVIWQGQDISTQYRNLCDAEVSGQGKPVPLGSETSGIAVKPVLPVASPTITGTILSGGEGSDTAR